ncbi:MAG: bile acid:sodium symporter family protein [Deltaproteobacteria bacterium]|nr:bile acid:sodium symporter family protein [Deltaproteobacteria bacterium]
MDLESIDQVRLNFNPQGLLVINIAIAVMMLGVAIDLKPADFKRIIRSPKAPAIGLVAQFILLPAATFLLILLVRPHPSMALGMILVAACPGGNLSNIMTHLARGNTAVSISMTAVSSMAAVFMTPLNLAIWGGLNPATAALQRQVSLSPLDVFATVFLILGIPLLVGQLVARWFPGIVERVRKPFKIFSLGFFVLIVLGALAANWQNFVTYVGVVILVVLLHNALALNLGYWSGLLAKLDRRDCRAVCLEVGIQNSALGLVLTFNFFDGLGGMAILVAWWGVWHIIAGLTTAFFFTRFELPTAKGDGAAKDNA